MENIKNWILIFQEQFKGISFWEAIGVSFGVAEVLFAKFNKVWLYPCGIISIVITAYLYFYGQLYAESLLQIYYLIMSIYGWFFWTQKKEGQNISYSTINEWMKSLSIVIATWLILFIFLKYYTNSDVPVWDSLVSAFAWAGMWLLVKRKIENWIFLNISNIVAVPLLLHKGFLLYAILTFFIFIIAIIGYIDWKKIIQNQKTC